MVEGFDEEPFRAAAAGEEDVRAFKEGFSAAGGLLAA